MTSNSMSYKEKLRRKQQQTYEEKDKKGLGKKNILDESKVGREVPHWQPRYKPDVNAFDILPFQITQKWFQKLRMPSGRPMGADFQPGDMYYVLLVPFHGSVGQNFDSYICLREAFGGNCAVCEDMFEAYKSGDKKKGEKLRPRWKCFYNIFDYDDQDKGIQLFEISYYCFEATTKNDPQRDNLIDKANNDPNGIVVFSDLEEGKTIIAKFKEKQLGKAKFPEVFEIEFDKRDPYKSEILQQVFPLDLMLVIPTKEEVREAHYLFDEEENKSNDQEEQENEDTSGRGRTRQEPTDQGNAEQSSQEEQPSQTSGRGRTRQTEPDKNVCPAGKEFGKEYNTGGPCEGNDDNSCDEDTFNKCADLFNKLKQEEKKEETTGRTRGR